MTARVSTSVDRVHFIGQSRLVLPVSPDTMPEKLMAYYTVPGEVQWINHGVGGKSWTWWAENAYAWRDGGIGGKSILIFCGGTADISNEGDTGAQCLAQTESLRDSAATAGFTHFIACTLTGNEGNDAGEETERAAYNTGLATNANAKFNEIADLDDTALSPAGVNNNPTYWADTAHWNAAGAQLAADTVKTALDAVLAL